MTPYQEITCQHCDEKIGGYDFPERMSKLRKHRKKAHPKAHRESIHKSLKTKRKQHSINPDLLTHLRQRKWWF